MRTDPENNDAPGDEPDAPNTLTREDEATDDGSAAEALRQAAHDYADLGLRVFPGIIWKGRRQPGVKAFYDVATTDHDQIEQWWTRWPDAWIAVATGPTNNLVVIDQDTKRGVDGISNWQALRPSEYEHRGPQARTASGGLHDWYRWDEWDKHELRNSASELAPGVDVRAWHGFVWVPPSGRRAWLRDPRDAITPPLPAWAVDLMVTPSTSSHNASGGERSHLTELLEHPPVGPDSGRNQWLTKVAGHYAAMFGDRVDAYTFHVRQANELLSAPLDDDEVQRTVESIMRAEMDKLASVDATDDDYPEQWTDAQVGEAFGTTLVGHWLYCRALGGWLQWDGKRWIVDAGEAVYEECRQWALRLSTQLYKQQGVSADVKAATRYRERGKIDAVVTIARRLEGVRATADSFDTHPYLLNVHNGVVDLRTGDLSPHDPELHITKLAGADYTPDATHADVDVLKNTMAPEVAAWVQKLLGSAAVGDVVDDIVAVLDGTGANGKTTLLKSVARVLGEYATPISSRLLVSKSTHDEHPTLVADLYGRRLTYIEETPEGGSLKMEQLKYLSGGNDVKARYIGKDWFTFRMTHQLVIATNHRPAVNASDYAAWRRLRLVPFPHTYYKPHEAKPGDLVADLGLRARVDHKAQREAMLAWIVAGAVAWHHDGLGTCEDVEQATATWRRSEDVIEAWWADTLVVDPTGKVAGGQLYMSYTSWCDREGRRPASQKEFAKRFTDHELYAHNDIIKTTPQGSVRYKGISLKPVGERLHGTLPQPA